VGITLPGFGEEHARWMAGPRVQVVIALLRDGFHPDSRGGRVRLQRTARGLDYSMTPYSWEGVRRAYLTMAESSSRRRADRDADARNARGANAWRESRAEIEACR